MKFILQAGPALKRQSSGDSASHLLPSLSRAASQDSPTKRPRLSLLSEDPGPCDSADEALPIQAVTVEVGFP